MNIRSPFSRDVNVRKYKYDGSVKAEWEGNLLPHPAPGWLLVGHYPDRHLKFTPAGIVISEFFFLHCCHLTRPLTILLTYTTDGRFREAKCDAALPATRQGNVVAFTDLDLDLIVAADLSHYVRDEAQFAKNCRIMHYPEQVVAQAHRGIAWAKALVTARHFPFDNSLVPMLKIL